MLELGPHEKSLAQQAYQSGEPLPDRIAGAPELRLGLSLYLNAFLDLDSERSHGMGLTPISWSAIVNYARVLDFCEVQTEDLIFFIRRMDGDHLSRMKDKQPKPGK